METPKTTSSRLPISVCMIAGAEAPRIRRALESVADWTSEIIVVINEEVGDGTDKITESFGARIFREPWKGYVAQKNSAAQKAAQEWILGLDADEIVSPELREEIRRLFAAPEKLKPFAAFSFPRLTFYCGRWIRHGDWYPDRQTRLWQRSQARWSGASVHERLEVDGRVGCLRADLLHHTAETIDHQIAKISRYSEDFLRDARARERSTSGFDLFIRPAWRFVRGYFFRLGFLDGWQGCHIAWMTAFYTATRYAKVRAAQEGKIKPD
jgi:glycosyltransferase involved in cell wall biosynthesis